MAKLSAQKKSNGNDSGLNFEAQLWAAADKMRGHMDASEYKHVCLGLIFPGACLKIACGPAARDFGRGQGGKAGASPQRAVTAEPTPATGKRPAARRGFAEKAGWLRCASVGDRCGYPPSLRLAIQPFPRKQDAHGISRRAPEYISDAFEEKCEQLLVGFSDPKSEWFIKDEPQRAEAAENYSHSASNEIPRPWERDLSRLGKRRKEFAASKGRRPNERARVSHWMSAGQVRVEGENPINAERVWVRCRIPRNADSFRQDLHPDLKADFVPVRKDLVTATRVSAKTTLAKPDRRSVGETELHPPFNMSDWDGENLRQDVRWKLGMPPVNNANYAWIQLFIHHLSPVGVAGFVMANGSV